MRNDLPLNIEIYAKNDSKKSLNYIEEDSK